MNTFKPAYTTITVESGYNHQKMTLQVPVDSDIDDYQEIFTTVLTFLTFSPQSIKDLFSTNCNYGDDYDSIEK